MPQNANKSILMCYRNSILSRGVTTNNLEGLHPGLVLKTMFLEPLKLSVYRLAKDIHVPQTRLSQIIAGERSITPDTALRLSKYFGLEEIFWLELQAVYDLAKQKALMKEELDAIQPFQPKNL